MLCYLRDERNYRYVIIDEKSVLWFCLEEFTVTGGANGDYGDKFVCACKFEATEKEKNLVEIF